MKKNKGFPVTFYIQSTLLKTYILIHLGNVLKYILKKKKKAMKLGGFWEGLLPLEIFSQTLIHAFSWRG